MRFRFLKARLGPLSIPFHRDFDEVSLRFYVRRGGWERRRCGVFVRELVPRAAVARVARAVYGEPYVACPVHSSLCTPATPQVEYRWRFAGR